ncbi:uncharacterized protein [Physcomitrium patens]|uniref:uncharacterized protein n=1 Tax=Physcomitrium patens TaxID=3218 RepID=UPI003CCE2528
MDADCVYISTKTIRDISRFFAPATRNFWEGDDGEKGGGLLSKLKPGGGSSSSSSSSSDKETEGARERNILRRQRRAQRQQRKVGLSGTAGTTGVAPEMIDTTVAPVGYEKKQGFF